MVNGSSVCEYCSRVDRITFMGSVALSGSDGVSMRAQSGDATRQQVGEQHTTAHTQVDNKHLLQALG